MTDEQTARTPTPGLRRRARRLAVAMLAAASLLALLAGGAGAVVVTNGHHRVSYELVRQSGNAGARANAQPQSKHLSKKPLEYNKGGRVMPSNTNYTIYWDPSGGAAFPAGYETGVNRYFEDVAHDSGGLLNIDSVLSQYGDEFGNTADYDSHFGGMFTDTNPYPSNGCTQATKCLTELKPEAELLSFVQAHSLPIGLEHEYFLITPKGVESCGEKAGKKCSAGSEKPVYCAFHNFIDLGKGSVIIWASDPYISGLKLCADETNKPNGNPSDELIAGGLAHEHAESVTDPELDAWHDSKYNEVADKCRTGDPAVEYGSRLGEAPNGSNYNQVINAHLYWYQQVWSNETLACAQRQLAVPTIKKLKPKSGPLGGGTVVTITGTGFTKTATVDFGEVEASEVTYESSSTLIVVSPPGTAPGHVFATVTTEGGTSATSNKTRFKYKSK